MTVVLYIALFTAGFMIDFLYVQYFSSVNDSRPSSAALCSMLISTLAIFGVANSINTWHRAIPYILGLSVGTWTGVFLKKLAPKDVDVSR